VLSGQVKRADMIGATGLRQAGIQEVDIISLVKSVTKYAVTVTDPSTIRYHLERAAYLASSGRPGPVWIDIPLDVQGAVIDEEKLSGFEVPEVSQGPSPALLDLAEKVITLLNKAERPVILAGNGIRLANGLEDFLRLVESWRVPVLTTWKAIDFLPEEHPFYFGRPGSIGQRGANFIQQNCDFIMVIGARLDLVQTGYNHKNFARAARKVVVDIDAAEIAKLKMDIDLPICADAADFLAALMPLKGHVRTVDRADWIGRCRRWKDEYPVVLPEYARRKGYVNTYVLVDAISELLTSEDLCVPGSSGACAEVTMQAFKVKKGQRIFNSPGLGSMGFGLPASMGACVASGGKRTVTLIGDGGLQHNIQELETVRRLGIPLKVFVLNNNGYGSIRNTQNAFFKGHLVGCDPSSGLTLPDTGAIAAAYGLPYSRILDHEGIRDRVAKVLAAQGPHVCEVMIDPAMMTAPKLSSEVKADGTIVSKPMEDLWPFLDRSEFRRNMIVGLLE
jgi:acetolactate synthase-1/2/3 large subunit